jgi:predicted AAA+ superfamily ATPase
VSPVAAKPSPYSSRVVDDELDELLAALPALVIEGAKGVGKTATASRRATTLRELDDPAQRAVARGDPARLLSGGAPILIDEWQRVPESWDLVRRAVDAGAAAGSFLLTGSALPAALPTHSGAGRIVSVRMRPLALAERGAGTPTVSLRALLTGARAPLQGRSDCGLEDYAHEIVASGLPGLRGLSQRALRAQLDGYLRRIVDRDFEELGHRIRNPAALRRWMRAYAAASSTSASFEKIRDAATGGDGEKPAKSTTIPYRDALKRLWILDPVPAWLPSRNRIARLSAPPKHQLADPALAARLLGVDVGGLLDAAPAGPPSPRESTLLGALFESLATLSVRVYAQAAEASVGHLRLLAGEREIDLIVERADGRVVAIEVKLAREVADADARHLHWLARRLGDTLLDAVLLTTGPEAYRRRDGIAVVPAALLGP